MTKQSNKRKFLATTLTATMVAAAVAPVAGAAAADTQTFPDVPADHPYAGVIADMVEAGVIKGQPDGNFNVHGLMTRAEAALIVASLLDLPTAPAANSTDFEDVKSNAWYTGAINSLKAEDIIAGKTATTFAPNAEITRAELSLLLVEAYGLQDKNIDDVELPFTDVKEDVWYTDAIKILYSEGLIKGIDAAQTKFAPNDNMKRGDFAWLSANVDYAYGDKLPKPEVEGEVSVESVKAINANTLEVTGEGLKDLKAADVTVAGNGVAKVEVSTDGKKATVTLTGVLAPNKDIKVTVKVGEETKEFTVNYAFNAPDVSVQDGVYDDDTADQRLTVLVKGQEVSLDYLHTAGYTVEFKAYNAKGLDVTSTLFDKAPNGVNTDGILSNVNSIGKYQVQVVLKKGSEITTSELANIEIRNLDNTSTVSEGYAIDTTTGIRVTDTLVVGEKAAFTSLFVGNGDTVTAVTLGDSKNYSVTSSNPSVLTVVEKPNNSGYEFTATGLGEATLTVKVGNATQTVTINVKGEARKAAAVTGANVVKPIVTGSGDLGNQKFKFSVLDQYGNAVVNPNSEIDVSYPTSVDYSSNPSESFGTGFVEVSLPVTKGGQSGTIVFKKKGTDNVIGTSTIQTTAVNNKDIIKLKSNSADDVIRANDVRANSITYWMEYFTSEDVYHSEFNGSNYEDHTIKFNDKVVKVEGIDNTGNVVATTTTGELKLTNTTDKIRVTPVAQGSTKLVVYNKVDRIVTERTVTVAQPGTSITGVNWKNPGVINYVKAVNYEDVLTLTKAATGSDHIVEGLQFSSSVVNKVRIKSDGQLYLDKNDNGTYQAGTDTVLGTLEALIAADPNFTNLQAGTVDAMTGLLAGGTNPVMTGSKGNVSFILKNAAGDTIATTAVAVDVKATEQQQQEAQAIADVEKKISDANGAPVTLTASDLANLTAGSVIKITKASNVTVTGTTPATFDFNYAGSTASSIAGGTIGNLTVNTPGATFTNSATVTGTTTIVDVNTASFINNGTLNDVVIEDKNGTRFENTGSVASLKLAGTGIVKLDGSSFPEVEITGNGTEITGTATGLTILVKADDVKVDNTAVANGNVVNEVATDKGSIEDYEADKEAQAAVKAEAAKFTATDAVRIDENRKLVLPTVTGGYTVAMTSDKTDVIANEAKNGSDVTYASENGEAATVKLTFTVAKEDVSTTVEVNLEVESFFAKPNEAETELSTTVTDVEDLYFMVFGINNEGTTSQKVIAYNDLATEFASHYADGKKVTLDTSKIAIADGKIVVSEGLLSAADWATLKADGKQNTPYQITILKGKNKKDDKIAKIQMYQDGKTSITAIED